MDRFEEVIKKIEQEHKVKNYWILAKESAQWLGAFLSEGKFKKVVEVGTSVGYSTLWIARALAENGGVVVTIESNKERFAKARENFESAGVTNVMALFDHAPAVFGRQEFQDFFTDMDVLFLDCIKKYYKEIYELLANKMKIGSFIVADNIISHAKDVADFVEAINSDKRFVVEIKDIGAGVLVARKVI